MRVAGLHAYPVKSCGAVDLDQARFDTLGIEGDRRFALIGKDGRAITQRDQPLLAAIRPLPGKDQLQLDLGGLARLTIPNAVFRIRCDVEVWGRRLPSQAAPAEQVEELCAFLGMTARLVRLDRDARQDFADAEPVLLTTRSSLAMLGDGQDMARFRPNIVVEDTEPLEELCWHKLGAGDIELECVSPCERCEIIGEEALRAVSSRFGGNFGVYCRVTRAGRLARGQLLTPGPILR